MQSVFSIHEPDSERPSPYPVLLEAPHTSQFVPSDTTIPRELLDSHEGYDIGSLELALHLQWELNAALIMSNRSRLYVEHNRTLPYALEDRFPRPMSDAVISERIAQDYQPYIDAVFGQIRGRFIERKRLPILICVHTYTTELHGFRRAPIGIFGDESLVLPPVLAEKMQASFVATQAEGGLGNISTLSAVDFQNPVVVNKPYNLNPTLSSGDPNPEYAMGMVPHYAEGQNGEGYDFPWVAIEVRQDIAKNSTIHQIVSSAIAETVTDQRVRKDLERRESAFFSAARLDDLRS